MLDFRRECRAYAAQWIDVQREEFKRLGVDGDWEHRYATMDLPSEAVIASEIGKFLMNGALYRGLRPVMWCPVEKTALAEAEIEYHDHVSPTVCVAVPPVVSPGGKLDGAAVVIWTTTPWTIPGNRAVAYGPEIDYALVHVEAAAEGSQPRSARAAAGRAAAAAAVARGDRSSRRKRRGRCSRGRAATARSRASAARRQGYDFDVPLLPGDFVTTEAGTGFVHIAPGHGEDDFELGGANGLEVPETVADDGTYIRTCRVRRAAGLHVAQEGPGQQGRARRSTRRARCWGRAHHPLLPAFLALQGAGDLPRHAAMVHRDGRPIAEIGGPCARRRWRRSMRRVSCRDAGRNRIARDGRRRGPTGASSRQRAWGVPIAVFVEQGDRRAAARSGGDASASSRPSRRRAPMPGSSRRRPSASSARSTTPATTSR